MKDWLIRLRNSRWTVQSAALAGTVLLAGMAVAPVAIWQAGKEGLAAVVAAAALCLAGAEVALLLGWRFREPHRAWIGFTIGMVPRMGVPLVAALIANFSAGPLVDCGFLYYLIVFYFVTLGLETAVSVPFDPPRGPTPPKP